MKGLLLIMLVGLTSPTLAARQFPNPVCIGEAKVRADVKREAAKRHPNSPSTQLYVLETDMEAYRELCSMKTTGPVSTRILKDVMKRHYPSYSTIEYVWLEEIKAYVQLHEQQ